jgi:O-antigen ligase
MKAALVATALFFTAIIAYISTRDNWLVFAPDYEKTISHTSFDNLLEATVKLEDISTMERVYRWVAASYMIKERPVTGFGPGCFYTFYKNYTVSSFKTYVSDNPEKSGIHNYFLMITVEQGLPGLFFYLLFCVVVMLQGESLYHSTHVPWRRNMMMAALLCFVLTNLLMLMNDFVETDKIGSLFIMSAAILANGSASQDDI